MVILLYSNCGSICSHTFHNLQSFSAIVESLDSVLVKKLESGSVCPAVYALSYRVLEGMQEVGVAPQLRLFKKIPLSCAWRACALEEEYEWTIHLEEPQLL